ncbi:MAG: YesL family protein [Oscillospiraceae bacterium]|nr:YesL family protein [Oscillospiraceae bacterium]
MFSMFSPDSKIMQVISRITDLVLLNILFLLTCLPVFTIGAGVTAMYTLCFRMLRQEEGNILKPYLRAFKENFKPATGVFALLALILVPDYFYFDRFFHMDGGLRYAFYLFVLIAAAAVLTAGFAFPWVSQFRNTVPQTLKNALLLSISNLPRAIAVAAINLLPIVLWIVNYDLFTKASFLWLVLYFAAAAYMNAAILYPVFKPYTQQQEIR